MITTYWKLTVTSLLIILAVLSTNPVKAQQEDNINETQNDQLVAQRNQFNDQYRQGDPQKQHADQQKQRGEQHKNIEAQRIAFITHKLNLTPEEAKAFWPVYNEYDAKRHELKKSFKNGDDFDKQDIDKLTETEASQILDNQIVQAQKFLDLRKEYHAKFKSVIPAVKVLKLYDAEREFQKVLMDKIRQHRQNPAPADKK